MWRSSRERTVGGVEVAAEVAAGLAEAVVALAALSTPERWERRWSLIGPRH
jgi:hypothetical protein